jgi:hypothetical protein
VFILEGLKVLCFDTLLQVFILKVDSGTRGAPAEFRRLSILLQVGFAANAAGKGVTRLARYFIGYYTLWLAVVKRFLVPFLGIGEALGQIRANETPQPWKRRLRQSSSDK